MKQHFCISNMFKMQLVVFELIQTDRCSNANCTNSLMRTQNISLLMILLFK